MQVYIVGIGQCGTSVAYDVIANLTGFVKSKDVKSRPGAGGAAAASNDLLKRMEQDLTKTSVWRAHVAPWVSRVFGFDATRGRKAFILPKTAIIDGNPDNFVKDAFGKFANDVLANEENERNDLDLKQLVALIGNTTVLGFDAWTDGCANSLVGEAVTTANLAPDDMRNALGVDDDGRLTQGDLVGFPVSVFLVVSSGGGATGSGGGVYLTKAGTLPPASNRAQANDGPNQAIVAHAIILPSLEASSDNKKYALNAGRALARHKNDITTTNAGDQNDEPSSVILFSNPRDEGDPQALQNLNNYLSEFAIRMANFTFRGNVAGITRDVDTRELGFLIGKTCVLAMSHLAEELWGEVDLESTLVERALANLYESSVDKPQGLSVESGSGEHDPTSVLATASSAMVIVGVPPKFEGSLKIARLANCLKEHSGSKLNSGIGSFAYGSAKHLELTVFLRYRTMDACPLAVHFVDQYLGVTWDVDVDEMPETDYIKMRANRDEHEDEYAETFEGFVRDLRDLGGLLDFDAYVVHRPIRSGTTSSVQVSGPEKQHKPEESV